MAYLTQVATTFFFFLKHNKARYVCIFNKYLFLA